MSRDLTEKQSLNELVRVHFKLKSRDISFFYDMHVRCRIILKFLLRAGQSIITTTWWCYQMETFSTLLALCAGISSVTGEFPSQRPVTRGFDVFFIYAWTNGWVNDRDAGDLRCHRAHYDVTVMMNTRRLKSKACDPFHKEFMSS